MLPEQNKTRCKAGKTARGQGRKDKRLFAKLLYVRGKIAPTVVLDKDENLL